MTERVVERLNSLNRTVVFLLAAAVVVTALLLPGLAGGVLLLVVAAGLVVLLQATWHRHDTRRRTARLVILGLALAIAVIKLTS